MDARCFVAVGCLAHALVVCFVIVPIKALALPAIGASPPFWVLLDPHLMWHGLQCTVPAITDCAYTALNLPEIYLEIATRVGICICAAISGYWALEWLSKHNNGR